MAEFRLPDVGEGLTEADILRWLVAPGDTVEVNQVLVEIETAKAAVELPSPFAGVVAQLLVDEGQTVDVGTPIISITVDAPAPTLSVDGPANGSAAAASAEPPRRPEAATDAPPAMLVGYGPRTSARRARRAVTAPSADAVPLANGAPITIGATPVANGSALPANGAVSNEPAGAILAKPPVRKLARDLGIDLSTIAPTGPNGTVSRADVSQAATALNTGLDTGPAPAGERETRIPIRGVRKHTAAAMVSSAFTAPQATEFITVDVTETMALRDRIAARPEFTDVKVSPLLLLARAVIRAALRIPELNSHWDEAAGEIVIKHYVNLGIAAATDRGLVVPNVKAADQLSLLQLAQSINALTSTARAGKSTPGDLAGGTITITNIGVYGVDTGTPILNPGEAAIVAFGAVRRMPWVIDEQIVPRWVTQLAVTIDHRLVDGAQASMFLADVAAVLHDPGLAAL
jgi:2-oxoisovalerate dehydrogenase E2 component (dihydrolipoyl transacylase)